MITQFEDRRRETRRQEALIAWLVFRDSRAFTTRTVDLTRQGARFDTLAPPSVGEQVLVHLEVPLVSGGMECKARVAWVSRCRTGVFAFGLRFVDLDDAECALLEEYLNEGRACA